MRRHTELKQQQQPGIGQTVLQVCNFSPVNKTNGPADLSQINHGNDNSRPKSVNYDKVYCFLLKAGTSFSLVFS